MSLDLKLIKAILKGILVEKPPQIEVLSEFTPSHDAGDNAAVVSEKEGLAYRLDRLRIKLLQVQVALDRMHNGDFGTCLACETEISEPRILAVPWTPFCKDCQDKLDRHDLSGFEHYHIPPPARGYGAFH